MKLVIVESPAKAKTIKKYLGSEFEVIASFGHVRDLPSKPGSVVPEQDFVLKYSVPEKATKHIVQITNAAAKATDIYLATDPDREGESISWHIAEIIKEHRQVPSDDIFKRIAFNEITKKAVLAAVASPRKIDIDLVNAQQARRALDYLVGFTLSPLLWRKLPGCRSAGRVQSVALRLICEQEEKIEQFVTQEYWDIWFDFLNSKDEAFKARLTHIDGNKLDKFDISDSEAANNILHNLKNCAFHVSAIEKKQQKRQPSPPFITSSLQQEAARKLGFSAKKTMQIAQKLYEGIEVDGSVIGLITYMRTDGVTMSGDAVTSIRALISQNYGADYLPSVPRIYKSKVKNAQEAHEAIRPTDVDLTPDKLQSKLDKDQHRLYDLIWKRTMACQMENVLVDTVTAIIQTVNDAFTARATGSTVVFDGFYRIYHEGTDDEKEEEIKILPILTEGEELQTVKINPLQHFTEPPPRYSEASLVKKLEELGIGRPSTYASILSVLQDREYVDLIKKRFIPEMRGRLLTVFLVRFFKKYVEYDFTAGLETELDEIASGKLNWKDSLTNFWEGFDSNIKVVADYKVAEIVGYIEEILHDNLFGKDKQSTISQTCPTCHNGRLQLKLGKFGAFLACSNYPDCTFKKTITTNIVDGEATELSNDSSNNRIIGIDHITGLEVHCKKGPYGWYLQLGEQVEKSTKSKKAEKPKRVPLPAFISPRDVTIEVAQKLFSLPVKIGETLDTNSEILMGIGRFGPYVKCDGTFYSIPKAIDPFAISVEQAMQIIATRKAKNKQKASKNAEEEANTKKLVTKKVGAKKAVNKKVTTKKIATKKLKK